MLQKSIRGTSYSYEAGQRLTELCQENALVITNALSQHTRDNTTHGHHQMVNTKIRLIYIFHSQRWRRSIQSTKTRLQNKNKLT